MQITKGKIKRAQKVCVYGPEGIGKSTFAAQFPEPLFIDTEGSTYHMDVSRTPKPSSWTMLVEQVKHIKSNPTVCKTLVIDTADWAEQLCINEICAKSQKSGIEDFGYGKGYIYLAEEFGRLLNLLEDIIEIGIHVVFTAHAQMRKFEQPNETGGYDRWELKLQRKTAPLLKEWADMVLFVNYKTMVVNVDGQGAAKGKNKAYGGKRVIYTTHHPCWDAKNRHGFPDEIALDFKEIAHSINGTNNSEQSTIEEHTQPPAVSDERKIDLSDVFVNNEDLSKIPKKLADLMACNDVSIFEMQSVVASKGYYPMSTPIENYDSSFVDGVLVAAWDQVYAMVLKERDNLPF